MVTYTKISPKLVDIKDLAWNAEGEKEEGIWSELYRGFENFVVKK